MTHTNVLISRRSDHSLLFTHIGYRHEFQTILTRTYLEQGPSYSGGSAVQRGCLRELAGPSEQMFATTSWIRIKIEPASAMVGRQ